MPGRQGVPADLSTGVVDGRIVRRGRQYDGVDVSSPTGQPARLLRADRSRPVPHGQRLDDVTTDDRLTTRQEQPTDIRT